MVILRSVVLTCIFLVVGIFSMGANSAFASGGLWALTGGVVLSGAPIGSTALIIPISSVGVGHFYTEDDCKKALKKIMYTSVVKSTSGPQGLFYDSFTMVNGVPTGIPGTEMSFGQQAGVNKAVMATCVEVGQ